MYPRAASVSVIVIVPRGSTASAPLLYKVPDTRFSSRSAAVYLFPSFLAFMIQLREGTEGREDAL